MIKSKPMKRLMMAAAALALLTSTAAANLTIYDRDMPPDERAAWLNFFAAVISRASSVVYVYDKHCETLPKEVVDGNEVGLTGWDPVITADMMKDVEEQYHKMEKGEFCKLAKDEIERIKSFYKAQRSMQ